MEAVKAAKLYFGDVDGEVIASVATQNALPHTPGGFQINDVHINPHNFGKPPCKHRIVIDYDSEYPSMLLRVLKITP